MLKRTMIPGDLLEVAEELINQIPLCPVDNKPWGPVEVLRYMLRAITIQKELRTPEETLALKTLVNYTKSETCQSVRLKRGVKRLEMEEDETSATLKAMVE